MHDIISKLVYTSEVFVSLKCIPVTLIILINIKAACSPYPCYKIENQDERMSAELENEACYLMKIVLLIRFIIAYIWSY